MALRDQPYIPLYVQDVLTDEKLIECSAATHGVYFRLLCILHKQESYGKIELKAKYKQNESKIKAFAEMLSKQMPFGITIISDAIQELIEERVMYFEGYRLCQKRMVHDFEISSKRALSGAEGGKKGSNSGTKRYYNEPGYLYLIYDKDDNTAFKVGISAEPEKRIKGIIRKTGRLNLEFRHKWSVEDMGESEQKVLDYFDDIRDGEWIYGDVTITDIESQIIQILNEQQTESKTKANTQQTESKTKANTEDESESENDNEINNKKESEFEIFRKAYPGTKRGHDVELADFKRKHKDWKEIIPILMARLNSQIDQRAKREQARNFVPQWKNLKTYLYQRSWEEEIQVDKFAVKTGFNAEPEVTDVYYKPKKDGN